MNLNAAWSRWWLLVSLALLLLPGFASPYVLHWIILILMYSYLGQCWNVVGGLLGRLSLGHAAFFGLGAYLSALLGNQFTIVGLLGSLAGACLAGLILATMTALLTLRYRVDGVYFSLFTIAICEVLRLLVRSTNKLGKLRLGGAQGLIVNSGIHGKPAHYYLWLSLLIILTLWIGYGRKRYWGLAAIAIRDDQKAAEMIGIDTFKVSLVVLALSGLLTGLGGALYASYFQYINPDEVFGLPLSISLVVRSVLGGRDSVVGPVLGSLMLTPLAEVTRSFVGSGAYGVHIALYGFSLVLITILAPEGIIPRLKRAKASRP